MKTYENYDLKNHTTSKISSFAKVVYIPESKEEFVDLLKTFDTPPVIIGGGSNVLLSSHGIDTPVTDPHTGWRFPAFHKKHPSPS